MAVLEASWRPSWAILAVLEAILGHLGAVLGRQLGNSALYGWPAGRAEAHWGSSFGKEPKPKPVKSNTPGTPVMNQQGAADRRRLRRITAAPCLFGNADVAESWARAWPSYRTMSSPSRFGKPSGNMWGRMNTKRKRKRTRKSRRRRRRRLLGSVLGHSWGLLGASWGPLGGLLEASWALLRWSWRHLGRS